MSVDALIDFVVATGQIETGTRADHALHGLEFRLIGRKGGRPQGWSEEETRFLENNLGRMPLEEIAARLGRSVEALKIRQVRQQLPAASKRPGYLTGNQVAHALGVDIHAIMKLHRRGLIPTVNLTGPRHILWISRLRLYMWAINPENWIYFRVARMGDERLQRLVQIAKSRWDDEWWTIGQAAAYHGLKSSSTFNHKINHKQIMAKQWGNWYLRRSVAVKLHFIVGKGKGTKEWSPRADAFILRAHAQGYIDSEIARMMKWLQKTVYYRRHCLEREEK